MTTLVVPEFDIVIDGEDYKAEIAECDCFRLEVEDHGMFVAIIQFKGSTWGQGISPHSLDEYNPKTKKREGTAFGCEYIMETVRVLGSPERAKGTRVVIFRKNAFSDIKGFAAIDNLGNIGQPFFPQKLADKHLSI